MLNVIKREMNNALFVPPNLCFVCCDCVLIYYIYATLLCLILTPQSCWEANEVMLKTGGGSGCRIERGSSRTPLFSLLTTVALLLLLITPLIGDCHVLQQIHSTFPFLVSKERCNLINEFIFFYVISVNFVAFFTYKFIIVFMQPKVSIAT